MMEDTDEDTQRDGSPTMEEAERIKASLDPHFPSFTKLLTRSYVKIGSLQSLPSDFCKSNSLDHDKTIVLVDKLGKEYPITYSAKRRALRTGWKIFCKRHRLVEGDALVFHLIEPSKFKVYIVKARRSHEIARDVAPPKISESNARKRVLEVLNKDWSKGSKVAKCDKRAEMPRHLLGSVTKYYQDKSTEKISNPDVRDESQNVENSGTRTQRPFVSFEEFYVNVNGEVQNSLLSREAFVKYYELCRARASHIHARFVKGISTKLAVEIISETVNIADAIRGSELATFRDDCATWDKALEGFEVLGMDVGFLRARINKLASLAMRLEETPEQNRLAKTRISQDRVDEMIKNCQTKLQEIEKEICELEETRAKLDSTADVLDAKVQIDELKYKEEANKPWSV